MEQERVTTPPHVPKDEDGSQPAGETLLTQPGAQSESSAHQDHGQPGVEIDDRELQQSQTVALQLKFQDSNLSPALFLLPVTSEVEHSFIEYSFFNQSNSEFAPLRVYPDVSVASEIFGLPPQDCTTYSSEHSSLSQATIISEDKANNSFTESQHNLSENKSKKKKMPHLSAISENAQVILSREGASNRESKSETQTNLTDKHTGGAVDDEIFFLRKDVPAQHLLNLLQKDVSLRSSSSSSASSSKFQTSMKRTNESKSTKVCKPISDESSVKREGPPGEANIFQKSTKQSVESRSLSAEISNITMGSRSTQPDDSSELLKRQLLSEAEKPRRPEAGSNKKQQMVLTPTCQLFMPSLRNVTKKKLSERANLDCLLWMGPFSPEAELVKEQNVLSSQNKTGSDGSYLGFLPQSQSTPAVYIAQLKSNIKDKLGQFSAIESDKENLYQSSTGITSQPAVPKVDACLPHDANHYDKDSLQTSSEVQFLPHLNFIQKVDAWRAKQNDSPTMEYFDGVSSKNKSHHAASNPLNQSLTQQAGTLRQPSVTGAVNQNATQSSSSAPSGSSSSRRGEAVGSSPCDKDNKGSEAPLLLFGKSQSHSSLSTVIMSVNKPQQMDTPPVKEWTQSLDEAPNHHYSSTEVHPTLMSLGHFSDVSFDQTLSSSQETYSGVKVGASAGTSSVVSLELDNYAPYWTSKHSAPPPPPKSPELNIDERIPLYLQNLGIDQTPSKILTPFAPRGPIREVEFSPTDLCTTKGSIGTPMKSTQPSEGGSPQKGEFSRSSILSVDSSLSIPFSLDSLAPAISIPEQVRVRTTSLSDVEAIQGEGRLAPDLQPNDGFNSFSLQPSQQQWDCRRAENQLPNMYDLETSMTLKASVVESNSNSHFKSSQSMAQDAENSFVSTNALSEIRKLLSHANHIISSGSSATSSAALPTRPFSDEDIFKSLHPKSSRIQDSLFSSVSTAEDLRTCSSLLWERTSSDSVLASEKTRQTSVGHESMTSSQRTDNNPFTQAVTTAPASVTYTTPQDSTVGGSVEMSLAIFKPAGRTEPEGCSAAPPDNIPIQPQVKKLQQLNSDSSDRVGVSEEEECSAPPAAQSHSFSSVIEDADQEEQSDGSSESSLAVRVAKLLQSESSATMMSITPSTTDQEESKTKEWIKLNIFGQQCELQELTIEDRQCIEEIKNELLSKNPIKSQVSTDTESSASLSLQVNKELDPSFGKTFSTLDEDNQHRLSMEHPESNTQLQCNPHTHLEARVCEIAAREGVSLSRKQCQTFTSITISTRRRSTFPSPSTTPALSLSPAPHPLHLTELSTGTDRPIITVQPGPSHLHKGEAVAVPQTTNGEPSVYAASKGFYNRGQSVMSQSASKKQSRQDTLGGQYEEFPPLKQGLDVPATIRHDRSQPFSPYEELCNRPSSVLGVDHKQSLAAGFGSTARPDYISHLHLKLSPKVTDHTPTSTAYSTPPDVASGLPQQLFVIPKDPSSAARRPDEDVGSSSLPECCDSREPVKQRAPERSDPLNLFKTVRQVTAVSTQSFTSQHKTEAVPGSPTAETSAPVLLPYKPHGSEELFYIPRTEADISCTEQSETTMESTHTGSDDALPPHFSRDILGNKDPGLDCGVTLRHPEGIYSKRLKVASFKMQHPELRVGASTATDKGFPAVIQMHKPSSLVAITFTGEASQNNHKISTRDQGTNPVQLLQYKPTKISHKSVHQVHVETVQTSVSQTGEQDLSQVYPEQSSSTLDHRWQKFSSQWITEVSRPASDKEASLLKRLERLSRLIHHTKTDLQEDQGHLLEEQLGRILRQNEAHQEVKRSKRDAFTEVEWKVRGDKAELPIQQRLKVEEAGENYGHASISSYSFSQSSSQCSSQSVHHSPADRDESETSSFISDSMSTVDTARLVQAFGPHKVQHLKGSSSLRKLYSTIDKQQERRDRHKDHLHDVIPSQTTATKEPLAPDSASTSSTCTVPLPRVPSRALTAKRAKRLFNKSVKTGDPEIVRNETLQHTRDVGTTFLSPVEAFGQISSSNMRRGRRGHKSPPKPHSIHRQRKNKRSPSKPCPKGVSWFISADTLSSETKKENRPAESSAWFEPYSRVSPWRAPLRQKQVHEDREKQSCFKDPPEPDPAPKTRTMFSDLTCVSLQESLEMHRPEFISRSRQRVRHLTLQVEERRLQAVFNRDRDMLFNQSRRPPRLPKPAGPTLLKRAVPRKEMIQRSKQIYESLPEVQQRREEERRKAECQSYRLNARLYNKRITNRVLGRRAAWH